MKDFKYKKQLILGISLALFICALVALIIFFISNIKTTLVSSNTNEDISEDVIMENTAEISEEETPEIVTDEKASEEELKKEKVDKNEVKKATSPYYIKVNYGANTVTIYKKDKDDNYTVPLKAMVCSCGTYTPTSGIYKTSNKYRWGKLIHNVYGQYSTRIVGSILFHSVPYSSNKNDTLLYDEYDKLGTTASAGCVRLSVIDAKWIYDNCPAGTMVEFYSDSNPGPLGKPTAQKISSVEECRNWDPTDPASGNPWRTYKPKEENSSENNTVINNTTNSIADNTIAENNSIDSNGNVINNSISNDINNNVVTDNNVISNTTTNTVQNSLNNNIANNTATNNSNNTAVNNTVSNPNINNTVSN